jgi:hypothetical protein
MRSRITEIINQLIGIKSRRNTRYKVTTTTTYNNNNNACQLIRKFPAFYGTRNFITAFKTARCLSQF